MNFRQVADHVKQRQRLKHRDMTKPEDDWLPEIYFLRSQGLQRLPIDTDWFENAATKQHLVHGVIVPAVRAGQVRVVALVVVMYTLPDDHPMMQVVAERLDAGEPSPTRGLPYFQDVDDSVERLFVHVFDAERHEAWCAQIDRPASGPPSLAPFELPGGPDAGSGLIADPIKAALR